MIIRREDENGDFVFGHGMADYLTENAAISLLVTQRLLLWLGEWFLDIGAGVNWPAILGSMPPAVNLLEAEVRRCVRETDGIVAINNLQMAFDHRSFTVDMSLDVTTEFGNEIVIHFVQILPTQSRVYEHTANR
jgi:hypothetical protein